MSKSTAERLSALEFSSQELKEQFQELLTTLEASPTTAETSARVKVLCESVDKFQDTTLMQINMLTEQNTQLVAQHMNTNETVQQLVAEVNKLKLKLAVDVAPPEDYVFHVRTYTTLLLSAGVLASPLTVSDADTRRSVTFGFVPKDLLALETPRSVIDPAKIAQALKQLLAWVKARPDKKLPDLIANSAIAPAMVESLRVTFATTGTSRTTRRRGSSCSTRTCATTGPSTT